ncbi:MAG: hypothetical protein KGL31_02180 [candidate division NC10 bacterium]|nr:hypothetical protein [candidate division NC10 bacterium]MDE2320713.1 hypothetical protein [candidate division NC10 bacterium]
METLYLRWLDPYLITILFTGLVIGAACFGLSVMPRWQDEERARARAREEETARTAKPTPVVELRKAA